MGVAALGRNFAAYLCANTVADSIIVNEYYHKEDKGIIEQWSLLCFILETKQCFENIIVYGELQCII